MKINNNKKVCEGILPIFYTQRKAVSMCVSDSERRLTLKKHSGVYILFSFQYGFVYIGKATDIYGRIMYHLLQKTDRTIIKVLLRNVENEVISNYTFPRPPKTLLDKIKEDEQFSLDDLYNSQLIIFPIENQIERKKFEKELIVEKQPRYNVVHNENNMCKCVDNVERVRVVESPEYKMKKLLVRAPQEVEEIVKRTEGWG